MSEFLPGIVEPGEEVDITAFPHTRRRYTAKWWYRPICWLTRRPTSYYA